MNQNLSFWHENNHKVSILYSSSLVFMINTPLRSLFCRTFKKELSVITTSWPINHIMNLSKLLPLQAKISFIEGGGEPGWTLSGVRGWKWRLVQEVLIAAVSGYPCVYNCKVKDRYFDLTFKSQLVFKWWFQCIRTWNNLFFEPVVEVVLSSALFK